MWQQWETALIASNTRALSQLVSPGAMLTAVIDRCALSNASCVYEKAPRPIRELVPIVPLQRRYPIHFLVEIQTNETVNQANGLLAQERWVELQILTKASAHASWRLSFDSGYDGDSNLAPPPYLPFDRAPAGPTLPAGGQDLYNLAPQNRPPIAAEKFLPLLAAYWQNYKETGHAPASGLIRPGGYTSGVGKGMTVGRQGSVYLGSRRTYHLALDSEAGQWTFAQAGGYPLVCGSIRDSVTYVPISGLLHQNPEESNWGIPLVGGSYLQIAWATQHETCVYVAQGGLYAVGNSIYRSQVTGKLASSALVNLETDYGVLAAQVQQSGAQLVACERAHPQAPSCTNSFARNAEQEFAQFLQVLTGTDTFPARVRGQVARLAATARHLTLLSGQLTSAAGINLTLSKIVAAERTLTRQYESLVHDLS